MEYLYHPRQPQPIGGSQFGICYREFAPNLLLKRYVCCYWAMSSLKPVKKPFIFHAVADGCIDIFFDRNRFNRLYMVGLADSPIFNRLDNSPDYFGVRFRPAMVNHFFSLPIGELYKGTLPFCELVGSRFRQYEERIMEAESLTQRIEIVDELLIERLKGGLYLENSLLLSSLDRIYRAGGDLSMAGLSKDEEVSPRHLRRIFKELLGIGPKKFARVIRFQNCYSRLLESNLKRIDLALESGYFDQAHFLKEFKEFYGSASL